MTQRRVTLRFLAAALLSVIAHATLMAGGWLQPSAPKPLPEMVLQARLERAAPPDPIPLAKPAAPSPERRAVRPARRPRAAALPARPPVATTPSASSYSLPHLDEAPDTIERQTPESLAASAEAQVEAPEIPSPLPEPEPVKTLPHKGRIAYTAYFGEDRFTVGKTVQTWEVEGQRYRLGSVSETTGIVELFRSQRHIYLSEGRFTRRGLEPEKFFTSRTRRGRTEAAQALFDWDARTVTFGRVPHRQSATLAPDAQDILSFMYQLALYPPKPGRMQLPITNGSRLETYQLDVLETERIETPIGILRALPVKQIAVPGDDSVEIWLAVDYYHLPVKIRFFDSDGRATGEQVVDALELSEP